MKAFTLTAVAALAVAAAGVSASGAAAKTTRHLSLTSVGAQVAPNESAYEVHGTRRGALIQIVHTDPTGTAGTSTSTFYDGHGTIHGRQTFTLSQPDETGIITIAGRGRLVSGTGTYKGIVGSYTLTGTFNTKTTMTRVKVTGSETY